jgi:hypothetical protein
MRMTWIIGLVALFAIGACCAGCQTGETGNLASLGHVITTTGPDGSVSVEQIPPTPAELAAWRDFAIQTAMQVAAMVEEFDDDDEKEPSTDDQIKLAMSQALLQAVNNWLVQNGGTAITIPAQETPNE